MNNNEIRLSPGEIFGEYRAGVSYKAGIGTHGIYEQTKMNERFFVGDQWHGVRAGNTRPLVRRNIIKRIGEYKMAVVASAPVAVSFMADGISQPADDSEEKRLIEKGLRDNLLPPGKPREAEISVICDAMSDYFRVTAERLRFDAKKEELLRAAFISGTGIAYTYWDADCPTGLYADAERTVPIKGDIGFEILDVENVNFGDPNCDDIERQPFIIIAQRRQVSEVRREAERNGLPTAEILPGSETGFGFTSGDRGAEPEDSARVTVLTKLYRQYLEDGSSEIWAVRVTEKAVIRQPWSLGISRYPIAKFCWERRRSSAYGDSEVTYLIPNQIAINRALSSAVHGVMSQGMPIMTVNGDVIPEEISNDPGQIIRAYGTAEDISSAIKFVTPPAFSEQYENLVNDIASNTLSDSGANDAALGNVRMDNASAIIQLREAATAPMQVYLNRFYSFIEDIARIWGEMWLCCYGDRMLKSERNGRATYIPFYAERYKNLSLTARIDVGAATLWGDAAVIGALDGLLKSNIITPLQYLERMPKGLIPDINGLISELKEQEQAQNMTENDEESDILSKNVEKGGKGETENDG